jgi:hypothetical protein
VSGARDLIASVYGYEQRSYMKANAGAICGQPDPENCTKRVVTIVFLYPANASNIRDVWVHIYVPSTKVQILVV